MNLVLKATTSDDFEDENIALITKRFTKMLKSGKKLINHGNIVKNILSQIKIPDNSKTITRTPTWSNPNLGSCRERITMVS